MKKEIVTTILRLKKLKWISVVILFFLLFAGFKIIQTNPQKKLNLEGLVTIDGKPTAAHIEIHSAHHKTNFSTTTTSDKVRGVFRVNLPLKQDYEVVVKVDKFPQQIIAVNLHHLDTTAYFNVFADFISPAYDKKIHELQQAIIEMQNKNFDKNSFGKKFGNFKKDGLSYQVQIGAFKLMENFNYSALIGMPKIIRKTDNDNITRFTIGNFYTYNEAFELLKNIQKKNIKDAFIICHYKSERKFLYQLETEKIVP